MVSRYLDIYNRWLWAAVILLMLFGLLAPISTSLSKVSIGLALGLTFARFGAEAWQKAAAARRGAGEHRRQRW